MHCAKKTNDQDFYQQLKIKLSTRSNPNFDFLSAYFAAGFKKDIIQVGANDGVMCDPLRFFLKSPSDYNATLIEPIPFYVEKLKDLYSNRSDIKVVQAAIDQDFTIKQFFI
jgi:hypothetical protein